jgi:hypothetical protein
MEPHLDDGAIMQTCISTFWDDDITDWFCDMTNYAQVKLEKNDMNPLIHRLSTDEDLCVNKVHANKKMNQPRSLLWVDRSEDFLHSTSSFAGPLKKPRKGSYRLKDSDTATPEIREERHLDCTEDNDIVLTYQDSRERCLRIPDDDTFLATISGDSELMDVLSDLRREESLDAPSEDFSVASFRSSFDTGNSSLTTSWSECLTEKIPTEISGIPILRNDVSIQFLLPKPAEEPVVRKCGRPRKPRPPRPLEFKDLDDQAIVTPNGRLIVITKATPVLPPPLPPRKRIKIEGKRAVRRIEAAE